MRRKPWSLIVLAIFHFFGPLGSMLLNAYRMDRTFSQQWDYWFGFLPTYLVATYILVPMLAGVFIYICRRWSYWCYQACMAVILVSNLYSLSTNFTLGTLLLLLFIVFLDVLVVAYFVVPAVQQLYFDSRVRWWEAANRYHFDHDATINGKRVFAKNLSEGGMLAKSLHDFGMGEKIKIEWTDPEGPFSVLGTVVYKNNRVTPIGLGIRFEHSEESLKRVKGIAQQLHAQGRILTERLPGPEDSFFRWLKRLIKTGEGIFPKVN